MPTDKMDQRQMPGPLGLALTHRIRRSPFHDRVIAAGCRKFSVYNHMLLPLVFESIEADYLHLLAHVQVWDVACQRQIEIRGADAFRLAQWMTPRDLSRCEVGQCMYAPLVDEQGGIVNDPVLLRLADDHFWYSLADSDALLWALGLARGSGMDVEIAEPDVSPLAIQGPASFDLMAAAFGEALRSLRFFRFARVPWQGSELIIARSGWSKQGGFEIYLQDSRLGHALWDHVFRAGEGTQLRAGCPNLIERIESGLLSFGSDMTRENNPLECGLERYCDAPDSAEVLCADALRRIRQVPLTKKIAPVVIEGQPIMPADHRWTVFAGEAPAGFVSSAAYSPRLERNIGIGMIDCAACEPGLRVRMPGGETRGLKRASLPFA